MTDNNDSGNDGGNEYVNGRQDAEKAAFGDESIGYSSDSITAEREILRERAGSGDVEAAEKLAGWGEESGHDGLAKAFEEVDEDVPEWAVVLAEQVEANAAVLEELAGGDEKAAPSEVFTR